VTEPLNVLLFSCITGLFLTLLRMFQLWNSVQSPGTYYRSRKTPFLPYWRAFFVRHRPGKKCCFHNTMYFI
jgi:hypothetical protein